MHSLESNLTRSSDASLDDLIAGLKGGGVVKPKYTPVTVKVSVCADHEDAAVDYLLEIGAGSPLFESVIHAPLECKHPFHDGDDLGVAVSQDAGTGWVGIGFACPECGWASMSQREATGHSDPAYQAMKGAFRHV